MNRDEHKKKQLLDPEYLAVEKELRPLIDLAKNILRLRLDRGWSQAELANRLGTRQANISRLESGQGNPTYKFLAKLSEALGVKLSIVLVRQDTNLSHETITLDVNIRHQHEHYTYPMPKAEVPSFEPIYPKGNGPIQ